MSKLNRDLRDGVEFRLPMWWVYTRDHDLVLRMMTAMHEKGTITSRFVRRAGDIGKALEISAEILDLGGNLDVEALLSFPMEVNIWDYGWDPLLVHDQEGLRAKKYKRQVHTNWDGWYARKRGVR